MTICCRTGECCIVGENCWGILRRCRKAIRAKRKGKSSGRGRGIGAVLSGRARRSVSVGMQAQQPWWKVQGHCCESCAHGGECEGGCGANCTCGKEGPARLANKGCSKDADCPNTGSNKECSQSCKLSCGKNGCFKMCVPDDPLCGLGLTARGTPSQPQRPGRPRGIAGRRRSRAAVAQMVGNPSSMLVYPKVVA